MRARASGGKSAWAGRRAVIVGASHILGKPVALRSQKEAAVIVCRFETRDPAQYATLADILIEAAGRPGLFAPQMVKAGAIVSDESRLRSARSRAGR